MYVAHHNPDAAPNWQGRARRRLAASVLLAALLIGVTILLLPIGLNVDEQLELELRVLAPESAADPEPVAQAVVNDLPEPVEPRQREAPEQPVPATPDTAPAAEPPVPDTDWYSQIAGVVAAVVAEQGRVYAANPAFDDKRRLAAVKFAPSRAPRRKPIWEHVETDQLGRKILVSGNCHRVIDDPNAANYEIFHTYQQYIVYCSNQETAPKELPWAGEIRARYDYLAKRDVSADGRDHFARLQ